MGSVVVSGRIVGRRKSEKYELPPNARIIDLIERTEFNVETVVVKRNDKIVPEEEKLEDGDQLEIIPIVSGG